LPQYMPGSHSLGGLRKRGAGIRWTRFGSSTRATCKYVRATVYDSWIWHTSLHALNRSGDAQWPTLDPVRKCIGHGAYTFIPAPHSELQIHLPRTADRCFFSTIAENAMMDLGNPPIDEKGLHAP
jgi:hypothetical protein